MSELGWEEERDALEAEAREGDAGGETTELPPDLYWIALAFERLSAKRPWQGAGMAGLLPQPITDQEIERCYFGWEARRCRWMFTAFALLIDAMDSRWRALWHERSKREREKAERKRETEARLNRRRP